MEETSLEQRICKLEKEVAELKALLLNEPPKANPWIDQLFGVFANEPAFEEAMRLGREYRESLDRRPWWERIWGKYANNAAFDEAMELGREYRESLRQKPRDKRK